MPLVIDCRFCYTKHMKLSEKYWHDFFFIGVCVKSLTGLIETTSGLLLLFVQSAILRSFLIRVSRGEFSKDPTDFFFDYSYRYIQHLTVETRIFAGFYILAHGLINLCLVWGLWKQKLQAYLIAIGVLLSFIVYQIYRIAMNHSLFLEILTALDILFVITIIHEYNYKVKISGFNA